MNIYVGNLSYEVTEENLRTAFEAFGEVSSAKIITDRATGASRGFGFVEMPNNSEADAAIKALNGEELNGNRLKISEAKPRSDKRRSGRGGGGGYRRF